MLLSKPRSFKLLFACLMAVGFFLPATMTATAQGNAAIVNGVKVTSDANMFKIGVDTSAQIRFKVAEESSKKIVVELSPATLAASVKKNTEVNNGILNSVNVSQKNKNVVVVTLLVSGKPKVRYYNPATDNLGLTVSISKHDLDSGAKVAKAPQSESVQKAPVVEKKVETKTVATKKVEAAKPVAKVTPKVKKAQKAVAPTRVVKKAAPARKSHRSVAKAAPVKTVSLELVNADLVYVVKYLAKEMGRNVFVAPDVNGTVTVTLHKVRPEGALALILKMQESDYDYKIVDNTVVVASPEKLATVADNILTPKTKSSAVRKNLTDQEFLLEAAPAAKVIEFLKGQYPDVIFTPHPTINGFYAKGTVNELRQIKSKLPNLDQVPAPPPAPRREYIPVKYGEVAKVQNLIKTLVPTVQSSVDDRLGLLIVEGTDAEIEQVEEALANLDKPLDQVMLDIKVVDLTESGTKSLGVTYSGGSGDMGSFTTTFAEVVPQLLYPQSYITNEEVTLGHSTIAEDGKVSYEKGTLASFNVGSFGRTPFLIQAALQFAISTSDAKVLASPRVATMSGQSAKVNVGEKYPVVYYDSRAGQFQVNYVDIGTKVEVKPEVKADGYIVAEVNPTVSSFLGLINNQYPRTAERTLQSKMRIKDGDTVVIGGLVQDQESHAVSKLPLLGDLPLIGALFRMQSDSTSRNEVVLMVTPHIMK